MTDRDRPFCKMMTPADAAAFQAQVDEYLANWGKRMARVDSYADMFLRTYYAPTDMGIPPLFWPGYSYTPDQGKDLTEKPTLRPGPAPVPPRCECGSNEPNCHSTWCPMHPGQGVSCP